MGKVHYVDLKIGSSVNNFKALDEVFGRKNKIKGVIVFNSACHKIANYIKIRNIHDLTVLEYDVVEQNVNVLKEGLIIALIAQ